MARTVEHDALARMGLVWWAARCGSCRAGHEVQVAPKYVADAAAIGVLYHSKFKEFLRHWGKTAQTIRYTIGHDDQLESHESGDIPDYFACVFEAKATRADFLSTFGGRDNGHANRLDPVAHMHWIVTERGVCEVGEVPGFWGLLVRRGGGLSLAKCPDYCPMTELAAAKLAERLLWNGTTKHAERLILPHCPECRGPLERQRPAWNRYAPAHLVDMPEDES